MNVRWSSGSVLDCQVRGPSFKPWSGQIFRSRFLIQAHHWGRIVVGNIRRVLLYSP